MESIQAIIKEITQQNSDLNITKMLANTESDPNCLKMNDFKIIPSRIISTLIKCKKSELNAEHKLKEYILRNKRESGIYKVTLSQIERENEILENIKAINNQILELKDQIGGRRDNDSMILSVIAAAEEINEEEEQITHKINYLENEKTELKLQFVDV